MASSAPQDEQAIDRDAYNEMWEDKYWKDGLRPGQAFDAAGSSPALVHLLREGGLSVAGERVFVPGAGRGYDVVTFAQCLVPPVNAEELPEDEGWLCPACDRKVLRGRWRGGRAGLERTSGGPRGEIDMCSLINDEFGTDIVISPCFFLSPLRQSGAAEVVGLDIAPSAVAAASQYVAEQLVGSEQASRARVIQGDLFKYSDGQGGFGVWFDYTMFCALPPALRPDWAAAAGRLVKPGGLLVTLMFPVNTERTGGPPFAVSPAAYAAVLEPQGFACAAREAVPPERSHPGREGKEHMALWRKA
eukprot:scaffold6.g2772.t1